MATVHVRGVAEAKRAIAQLAQQAPDMADRAIRAGGAVLGEAMEKRAPDLSDDMEGTIARSIHMRPAGQQAVLVGTNHGLARIFEEGGEITPTRRERLRFMGTAGEVFAEQVTIPASPFIRPAVDESRARAVAAVKRSAKRSIQRRGR